MLSAFAVHSAETDSAIVDLLEGLAGRAEE